MARYRLQRLEAAHWRGIGAPLSVPFDKPLNIVHGPNGSGKSSLLTAIEFALFPREALRMVDHRIDERREWESRHVHGREPSSVRLTLIRQGREVVVGTGREPSPARALYADFKGLAFLHQETIRDFLTGTPAARQSAFQRLLGAGWAQDLAKAFDSAARDLEAGEADARVAQLEGQLHTRLLEARRQLSELEAEARTNGLSAPWPAAEAAAAAAVEALNKSTPPAPAAAATTRKLRLDSWRSLWQDALARRAAAPMPDPARLDAMVAERDRLNESLRSLDRYSALLRDALAHVRTHATEADCPVCQQPTSPALLAAALELRLGKPIDDDSARLRTRLTEAQREIAALDRARADAARAQAEVDRARLELTSILGRALHAAEDPAALATQEFDRLTAEVERETQALAAARERLAELARAQSRHSLARRVAAQGARVERLTALRDTPVWHAMLDAQRRLGMRELLLQHASAAVKAHATQVATDNLERARKPIANMYSQLTQRGDFPLVAVFPHDKFEVNVASEDNRVVAATGILNLTDLNCLALAVTAGMAVAFPAAHDLDFLILDDPSQGMDPRVTARLAPILGFLAKRLQVVVATPDEALVEALRAQPVYKNVVTLAPRDPGERQPQVRILGTVEA